MKEPTLTPRGSSSRRDSHWPKLCQFHFSFRPDRVTPAYSSSWTTRSGTTGAGLMPHCPMTIVVTPCSRRFSPSGCRGRTKSAWLWMKPGASILSPASTSAAPPQGATFRPTSTMTPSRTRTPPRYHALPLPSQILAFVTTNSDMQSHPSLKHRMTKATTQPNVRRVRSVYIIFSSISIVQNF